MSRLRNDAESPNQRLARRLRALREARGLSQEALADLACMDRSYASLIEHGAPNVSAEKIQQLAVALGVDASELFASN